MNCHCNFFSVILFVILLILCCPIFTKIYLVDLKRSMIQLNFTDYEYKSISFLCGCLCLAIGHLDNCLNLRVNSSSSIKIKPEK